ncbi:hypothetical protein H696_00676 [Fonticula alba]|uniref:Translation initiation factor eIF2B subunit alpha n=1 Tax=Fonticula alba TaxID=691883 RepID=A0A058ZGR7_FONAL|nr:hypothetical protein H696_00676 [Fonticula alba]KCV73128.1 hypothetical protein H696_00676 [Fonticula alba]|eukprot:XP_009492829.1 hypothetical protein H696_00676 [Fonticula alba]
MSKPSLGQEAIRFLNEERSRSPETPLPVAAVVALSNALSLEDVSTTSEIFTHVKLMIADLLKYTHNSIGISAGSFLFQRFVARTLINSVGGQEAPALRDTIVSSGRRFAERALRARAQIVTNAVQFIQDGQTVLAIGFSRMVLDVLLGAAKNGVRFDVLVTESRPAGSHGHDTVRELTRLNIPAKVLPDAAVAHTIQRVDLVLTGAQGVVESGGVINEIGTYQSAIVARAAGKPFYVVAESYKFVRAYPLDQTDIGLNASVMGTPSSWVCDKPHAAGAVCEQSSPAEEKKPAVEKFDQIIDYTPPELITLLFTDIGILTPAAVSDELIQLHM